MPREIVAEADKSSPPLQFPEQRVAAPYPLSALAGCRATAQAIDQALRRGERRAYLIKGEGRREKMSCACLQ